MSIIYPNINVTNFATTGSNTFVGDQTITGTINLTGAVEDYNAKVTVNTATSGVVNQFSASHNAARFTAMVETSTGTYHVQSADLLLAHNNSSVLITPYALTCTSGSYLAIFDAQISGSNIQIVARNLVNDTVTVTMTKTYLA
jgi:hypothetical protein